MKRWFQAVVATALWAFVLTGLIGLVEAGVQWIRFGPPSDCVDSGTLRILAPAFTLYGWLGLGVAMAVAIPVAAVIRVRGGHMRSLFGWSVAAALGLICAVYFGYLIAETQAWSWWTGAVGPGWPLKLLVWLLSTLLMAAPLARFAGRLVANPRRNIFLPIVVVVVATALWPDWRDEARQRQVGHLELLDSDESVPSGYDVLLVTVDTLRRDRLSCLSETAPPTPHLDALAAEGILYANAWTTSSWTLPNMAAIHTGLTPRMLGLSRTVGLPESAPTVAETAWRAGWRTVAVASNPYLGYDYGFQKGFGTFDHAIVLEPLSPAARSILVRETTRYVNASAMPDDAQHLVGKSLRWFAADRDERPVFFWLHLMDPHLPYRWRPLPGDDTEPVLPDSDLFDGNRFMGLHALRAMTPEPSAEILAGVTALYDREVRYADAWIGELLDYLRRSGRLDNTVVIVVADHGEEFFEHGGYEHGHSLLPEVAAVPLIVRLPDGRGAGRRIDRDVSIVDIVPTLCREMGWRSPEDLPGRNDLWSIRGGSDSATGARIGVLENMLYGSDQQSWLSWPHYRIENQADGGAVWFDLAADPGALIPLPEAPAGSDSLASDVRGLLNAWDERARQLGADRPRNAPLSEATVRRLESLGY